MSEYGIICRTHSGRKAPIHRLIMSGLVHLQYLEPLETGQFPDSFTLKFTERGSGDTTHLNVQSHTCPKSGIYLGRMIDTVNNAIEIIPFVQNEKSTTVMFTLTYSFNDGDDENGLSGVPGPIDAGKKQQCS